MNAQQIAPVVHSQREFPIEVLLSITTGILLCEFGDMHECIEFLAGGPVFTHQLAHGPFVDELRSALLFQCPTLANPQISVVATGKLTLMLEAEGGKVSPENLILGWLSSEIWPLAGRTLTIQAHADMRNAAASFAEPLEGKEVIGIVIDADR